MSRQTRVAALAFGALVVITLMGWAGGRQIRSPAQVAADTAAPTPSQITVPVTRQSLATNVIVRGTVRFGAPQSVVLATSAVKQAAGGVSDIVTQPPHAQKRLRAGDVALAVDGRPVFVLPGAIPMHRDLGPGDRGPDVLQLERALAALGYSSGRIDGRYDTGTERAVAGFYLATGWDPFGPTDVQLDQLRTAQTAAAAARDARLQALNNRAQARLGPKASDVTQARIDAVAASDRIGDAQLKVRNARAKLAAARSAAAAPTAGDTLALSQAQRDQAQAEIAAKQQAVAVATEDARQAEAARTQLPPDATLADRQAAEATARQATAAVAQAQADLASSVAAARTVGVTADADVRRAQSADTRLQRDVRVAEAELRRAEQGVPTARRQSTLAAAKARVIGRRPKATSFGAIVAAAAREERRTDAEVRRLAFASGIQVPADEVLFFPSLPLRVDKVTARRGSTVSGSVMEVTNSRLAIDSSLSVSDQRLVRVGDRVRIEEQDLGVTAPGRVTVVARTPGTNRVDPTRFYLGVAPAGSFPALVGVSVKLTISVKSTKGRVLAVPVSALSVGGDGRSRVQVRRGGRSVLVPVTPGLAAEGLAEVRTTGRAKLSPGDLVVVGSRAPTVAKPPGGGP